MSKKVETHKIRGTLNGSIDIEAVGDPGAGSAHTLYRLLSGDKALEISFQTGDPNVVGANGFTNEVLLAVLIDRLEGFQGGPYKCRENAIALTHIETALLWLQSRTNARLNRGVEGQSVV